MDENNTKQGSPLQKKQFTERYHQFEYFSEIYYYFIRKIQNLEYVKQLLVPSVSLDTLAFWIA